jgi:cupin 2 domain-containing protein
MPPPIQFGNLFAPPIPLAGGGEIFEALLEMPGFRLERIVSLGHNTPEGRWYDQERAEWVLLLRGAAGLRFEGEADLRMLKPGDYLLIPAHCRHRVEWTAEGQATFWLALHFAEPEGAAP